MLTFIAISLLTITVAGIVAFLVPEVKIARASRAAYAHAAAVRKSEAAAWADMRTRWTA